MGICFCHCLFHSHTTDAMTYVLSMASCCYTTYIYICLWLLVFKACRKEIAIHRIKEGKKYNSLYDIMMIKSYDEVRHQRLIVEQTITCRPMADVIGEGESALIQNEVLLLKICLEINSAKTMIPSSTMKTALYWRMTARQRTSMRAKYFLFQTQKPFLIINSHATDYICVCVCVRYTTIDIRGYL